MTNQIETKSISFVNTLCMEGWRLRLDWYATGKQVDRVPYELHIRTCPDCQAYYQELTAAAENAVHPEVEP